MKWNTAQEAILIEFCNFGAQYCRDMIFKKTGVYRSVDATKRHASRIGASLVEYQICPVCGRVRKKLNKVTGLCEVCHIRNLSEKHESEIKEMEEIDELISSGNDKKLEEAKRRYNNMRQRARRSRARVEKRANCENFANMSFGLSTTRSEAEIFSEKEKERPEGRPEPSSF